MLSPTVIRKKPSTIFICDATLDADHPLVAYLSTKAFIVRCIRESSQAIGQIITSAPDIVLLGAHLPVAGAYDVCAAVRSYYNGLIPLHHANAPDKIPLDRGGFCWGRKVSIRPSTISLIP